MMNRTRKILGFALLIVVLAVMVFALAEIAPSLMASVGWHDLASVGWHGPLASIGWHTLASVG
jgi:hypothetical protein